MHNSRVSRNLEMPKTSLSLRELFDARWEYTRQFAEKIIKGGESRLIEQNSTIEQKDKAKEYPLDSSYARSLMRQQSSK